MTGENVLLTRNDESDSTENMDVTGTGNEVILQISTTKQTDLVQGTFKTAFDTSGNLVYGSAREDHDNSDISPILTETVSTEDTIAIIYALYITSDPSKGNWKIISRDLERVDKVTKYMRNQATTEETAKLNIKCPVLKLSANEADALKFKNELIRAKSEWENDIKIVTRTLQIRTMNKLLVEEKDLRDPDSTVIHRTKRPTLSAVSRRISQLETAKNNVGKTVSANTIKPKKTHTIRNMNLKGGTNAATKTCKKDTMKLSPKVPDISDDTLTLKRKREAEKNNGCL